jgi:hypothetical protein
MTPKDKAEILVAKFIKHSRAEKDIKPIQSAKQCALIAVDEILNAIGFSVMDEYWSDVKQEIEKL